MRRVDEASRLPSVHVREMCLPFQLSLHFGPVYLFGWAALCSEQPVQLKNIPRLMMTQFSYRVSDGNLCVCPEDATGNCGGFGKDVVPHGHISAVLAKRSQLSIVRGRIR